MADLNDFYVTNTVLYAHKNVLAFGLKLKKYSWDNLKFIKKKIRNIEEQKQREQVQKKLDLHLKEKQKYKEIGEMIAEFSVGFTFYCSNPKCKKEINFNNTNEIARKIDYNQDEIFTYSIPKKKCTF